MAISVHDNLVVSYEVHCERREIRLHTEFRDGGEPFEHTLVIFTGVEAYHFEHDCHCNILFDVVEISAEGIVRESEAQFREEHRFGWPRFWSESMDEVQSYLREHAIRGYQIASSYGMSGWVLARDMQMITSE
jgi:hypothetical protein